jgi:two-component sensor histidine kinase
MIRCELLTNAVRHAFKGDGGQIRVAVWLDAAFVNAASRTMEPAAECL